MALLRLKQWLGARTNLLAATILGLSLVLYTIAYLLDKGLAGLTPGTVLAAVATALLLAAVSVTLEQYIKTKLTDGDVVSVLNSRRLGILQIQERNVLQGQITGMPSDILDSCRRELFIVAYAADNFVERHRSWIIDALDSGIRIGILVLHPDHLEQAEETEGLNIYSHVEKALVYNREILLDSGSGRDNFEVRGHQGHFYFTGIFVDRAITEESKTRSREGMVCVQLKANFKSQHRGIVLTLAHDSPYSEYYSDSCRELWRRSTSLANATENKQSNKRPT